MSEVRAPPLRSELKMSGRPKLATGASELKVADDVGPPRVVEAVTTESWESLLATSVEVLGSTSPTSWPQELEVGAGDGLSVDVAASFAPGLGLADQVCPGTATDLGSRLRFVGSGPFTTTVTWFMSTVPADAGWCSARWICWRSGEARCPLASTVWKTYVPSVIRPDPPALLPEAGSTWRIRSCILPPAVATSLVVMAPGGTVTSRAPSLPRKWPPLTGSRSISPGCMGTDMRRRSIGPPPAGLTIGPGLGITEWWTGLRAGSM